MDDAPARQDLARRAREGFAAAFGRQPQVTALAPGRVNLIGEHTDYNDGLVMPMAIDAWCACAAGSRDGAHGTVGVALDVGQRRALATPWPARPGEHDVAGTPLRPGEWMSYVAGVLHGVARGRPGLPPLDLALTTTIPIGGGLSSSAALEVSVALAALAAWGDAPPPPLDLARLCQRAEHEFASVPCGLMDQCASLLGRAGHALLLDCRTLEHRPVPIPPDVAVVVVDTGVRHALAAGAYAVRREQCAAAARALGVGSLRDVGDVGPVESALLPETLRRRARHVVSENQRVLGFARALSAGDLAAAGELMAASHASLRDDYEVSCPELDRAVDGLAGMSGVLGARMTGGGFGGCAIALAARPRAEDIAARALAAGLGVSARVAEPASGAVLV